MASTFATTLNICMLDYQVSWPLELIANAEAIKKYNQVISDHS